VSILLWQRAVGVARSDGSDQRLLLHHYSHAPTYSDNPWPQPSPDGKVAIFNSNMNGSGRYDLFVAEVPLR
jgi:Tol biopolymer transport system component